MLWYCSTWCNYNTAFEVRLTDDRGRQVAQKGDKSLVVGRQVRRRQVTTGGDRGRQVTCRHLSSQLVGRRQVTCRPKKQLVVTCRRLDCTRFKDLSPKIWCILSLKIMLHYIALYKTKLWRVVFRCRQLHDVMLYRVLQIVLRNAHIVLVNAIQHHITLCYIVSYYFTWYSITL